MTRLSSSTSRDLVTLSDLRASNHQFIYELKITGFRLPSGRGAIQEMKEKLSEFIREKMGVLDLTVPLSLVAGV